MSTKPLSETYVHTYEGKIQKVDVTVHINYFEGLISLIDHNPKNPASIQGKQWIFQKRSMEYMMGWLDILDAMKSAIGEASRKLQEYQNQEEQENLEFMMKMEAAAKGSGTV